MTKKYFWAGTEYSNMEEVTAAANMKKHHMNTCPCDFVEVKLLSGSTEAGWSIPQEKLTHEQVLAVTETDTNYYSVSSVYDGDVTVGLTASEMIAEVNRMKRQYGTWMQLDKVWISEEVAPEVDMSAYVENQGA